MLLLVITHRVIRHIAVSLWPTHEVSKKCCDVFLLLMRQRLWWPTVALIVTVLKNYGFLSGSEDSLPVDDDVIAKIKVTAAARTDARASVVDNAAPAELATNTQPHFSGSSAAERPDNGDKVVDDDRDDGADGNRETECGDDDADVDRDKSKSRGDVAHNVGDDHCDVIDDAKRADNNDVIHDVKGDDHYDVIDGVKGDDVHSDVIHDVKGDDHCDVIDDDKRDDQCDVIDDDKRDDHCDVIDDDKRDNHCDVIDDDKRDNDDVLRESKRKNGADLVNSDTGDDSYGDDVLINSSKVNDDLDGHRYDLGDDGVELLSEIRHVPREHFVTAIFTDDDRAATGETSSDESDLLTGWIPDNAHTQSAGDDDDISKLPPNASHLITQTESGVSQDNSKTNEDKAANVSEKTDNGRAETSTACKAASSDATADRKQIDGFGTRHVFQASFNYGFIATKVSFMLSIVKKWVEAMHLEMPFCDLFNLIKLILRLSNAPVLDKTIICQISSCLIQLFDAVADDDVIKLETNLLRCATRASCRTIINMLIPCEKTRFCEFRRKVAFKLLCQLVDATSSACADPSRPVTVKVSLIVFLGTYA